MGTVLQFDMAVARRESAIAAAALRHAADDIRNAANHAPRWGGLLTNAAELMVDLARRLSEPVESGR